MPPANVAAVFSTYPPPARARALALRKLVFECAAADERIGPLTETLKWGEPAYLTDATKAGTTVRLGWKAARPEFCSIFVNCKTSLVDEWRAMYGDSLALIGNREILLPIKGRLPVAEISHCLKMALTYHAEKSRC